MSRAEAALGRFVGGEEGVPTAADLELTTEASVLRAMAEIVHAAASTAAVAVTEVGAGAAEPGGHRGVVRDQLHHGHPDVRERNPERLDPSARDRHHPGDIEPLQGGQGSHRGRSLTEGLGGPG